MRIFTAVTLALGVSLVACSQKGEGGEEAKGDASKVLDGSGQTSFDPTGRMYVVNQGMNLAIRMVGDDRTFWLTAPPPKPRDDEAQEGTAAADAPPVAGKKECVPLGPADPVPGPQGGWHGHPAWSPDGRFIAFMAQWDDMNCKDSDDGDWDIWVVNVDGLDLEKWVREVQDEDAHGNVTKSYYVVGPDGSGLRFYQATSAAGPEKRPAWASCDALAYSTADGLEMRDLSSVPGICERTIFDVLAEREKKISELEAESKKIQQACQETEQKLAALEQPVSE